MGDYLRSCEVSVAPMQSGSGMQNKVLEAMACGVPTVVTPLGLGDIAATPGVETLVSRTAEEFARNVSRVLGDATLRERVTGAARTLVRARYVWQQNAASFEEIAERCVRSFAARRGAA
jgi:glycosyltransferase involved in cell wall biosynthesis